MHLLGKRVLGSVLSSFPCCCENAFRVLVPVSSVNAFLLYATEKQRAPPSPQFQLATWSGLEGRISSTTTTQKEKGLLNPSASIAFNRFPLVNTWHSLFEPAASKDEFLVFYVGWRFPPSSTFRKMRGLKKQQHPNALALLSAVYTI